MSNNTTTRIGLIGLGNLGSAIGNLVAAKGIPVLGWEYNSAVVEEINRDHTNLRYLPGIPLEPALTATTDISAVLESCRIVFIALPSAFIQSTLRPVRQAAQADCILVNMAKGIDGVKSVQNLLQVVPASKEKMTEVADKDIEDRVKAAFKAHVVLKDSGISVTSVNKGVVLLSGRAKTIDVHLTAIETAKSVSGVRRVATQVTMVESR